MEESFIQRWISLLEPAKVEALRLADAPMERQQQALEHASVRHSLENLKTFPFVRHRLESGNLRLRGAYFDISSGELLSLDPESGEFAAVD